MEADAKVETAAPEEVPTTSDENACATDGIHEKSWANDAAAEGAVNAIEANKVQNSTAADSASGVDAAKFWDNTDRKVVIYNMFRYLDNKKGAKLAQQWAKDASSSEQRLEVYKVRKPPSDTFMVVTLAEPEMVQTYIDYINQNEEISNKRGVKLLAKRAQPTDDDNNDGAEDHGQNKKKRKGRDDINDGPGKKAIKRQQRDEIMEEARRPVTEEQIKERITPLYKMSRQQQTLHKQREMIKKCAIKIVQECKARFKVLGREPGHLAKNNGQKNQVYAWLKEKRCIPVDELRVVPSPLRNKVEFTFGYRYVYVEGAPQNIGKNDDQEMADVAADKSGKASVSIKEKDGGVDPDTAVAKTEEESANVKEDKDDGAIAVAETKADHPSTSVKDEAQRDMGAFAKTGEKGSSDARPKTETKTLTMEIPVAEADKDDADGQRTPDSNAASDEKSADVEMSTVKDATDQSETPGGAEEAVNNIPNELQDVKKIPSLGFMAAGWSGGVSKPHCCDNIPSDMCALVDAMEDFLQQSPLPPYDPKSHQGFWRFLTVRSSRRTQQCMVIICHSPPTGGVGDQATGGADYIDAWATEKDRLVQMLQSLSLPVRSETGEDLGITLPITSFFLQEYGGVSNPPTDHPVQHVFGKTVLEERLSNCNFQISPGAFFQVNTAGAELLYQLVMDKLTEYVKRKQEQQGNDTKKKVILFDVCCGTGTIGLACMKGGVVDSVIGVDISEPAIDDAKRNAEVNGFGDDNDTKECDAKTRFVASRAEYVMNKEIGRVLKQHRDAMFLAVVDPAREGLHTDVVKALRQPEEIERIVYVSCNPTGSLIKDAGLLCSPPTKKYSGRAFRPTSASPVDMFPLTNHCEMVMAFDRVQDSDL